MNNEQKPNISKNHDATSAALYLLEVNGFNIEDPTTSECGRFRVSPETYGFAVQSTGGGFWAHQLEVTLDGLPFCLWVTDVTGERCITDADNRAVVGLFNDGGEQIAFWEVER